MEDAVTETSEKPIFPTALRRKAFDGCSNIQSFREMLVGVSDHVPDIFVVLQQNEKDRSRFRVIDVHKGQVAQVTDCECDGLSEVSKISEVDYLKGMKHTQVQLGGSMPSLQSKSGWTTFSKSQVRMPPYTRAALAAVADYMSHNGIGSPEATAVSH